MTRRSIGVLLAVLMLAVAVSALTAWRQGWLTPHATLRIEMSSNPSLAAGVPVKVKGFAIGHVTDVRLSDAGIVQVQLQVASRYMPFIASDAKLRLKREGLIGAQYLEFDDGTSTTRAAEGALMAFDSGVDWAAKVERMEPMIRQILANTEAATSRLPPMMDKAQVTLGTVNTTLEKAQPDALRLIKSGRAAGEDAANMMSDLQGSGLYRLIAPRPAPVENDVDAYDARLAQ